MMQTMYEAIHRRPMNQPMYQVEVDFMEERNQAHQQHAINGMCLPSDVRQKPICLRPQRDNFVCRPNRDRAHDRPEDIIEDLLSEQEGGVVGGEPARAIFESRFLRSLDIEPEMPGANNETQ